jgi:translation initiation factor 1 (eIF-1/SUI1)
MVQFTNRKRSQRLKRAAKLLWNAFVKEKVVVASERRNRETNKYVTAVQAILQRTHQLGKGAAALKSSHVDTL